MAMRTMAVAMAMIVVVGSVLQGTEAQVVDCLTNAGGFAPFADANTVVQNLRLWSGVCYQIGSGFCTMVVESGNAAATVYGPQNFCPNCADVGNDLNQVLAQCNQNNQIEGVISLIGSSTELFYLTSTSNHP